MATTLDHSSFCYDGCRFNAIRGFRIAKSILDLSDDHPRKWEFETMAEGFVRVFTEHQVTAQRARQSYEQWQDDNPEEISDSDEQTAFDAGPSTRQMEKEKEIRKYHNAIDKADSMVTKNVRKLSETYYGYLETQAASDRAKKTKLVEGLVQASPEPLVRVDKQRLKFKSIYQLLQCYAYDRADIRRKARDSGLDEAEIVVICGQRCKQLCEAHTQCEEEANALPDSHPQKAAYRSWCAAIAEKLYEHSDVEDTTYKRWLDVSAKTYRTLIEMMLGLALKTLTAQEHEAVLEEFEDGLKEKDEIANQNIALRRKKAHNEIQGMLDQKPEIEVISNMLEAMMLC